MKSKARYKGKGFKGNAEANKKYIYNALIKDGFTHEAATGIVGNILLETGNFKYIEEISPNVNNQRGLGLLQWSGPRATDFEAWLKSNNKNISSVKDNVEYLLLEMKKKSRHHWSKGVNYEKMKKIGNVEEATTAFMSGYLRPNIKSNHLDQRLAYASKYDKIFKGEKVEDNNTINKFELSIDEALRTNRIYTDANITADKALKKIDFSQSTIGEEDMDKFRASAISYALNRRIMEGKEDPYAQVVTKAFIASPELNKEIMEGIDSNIITPSESPIDEIENSLELSLGGVLQPNGRKSQFLREEDLIAQNNTNYTP